MVIGYVRGRFFVKVGGYYEDFQEIIASRPGSSGKIFCKSLAKK